MKIPVLFILAVFTLQVCESKVTVKPGFTKNLLDVIGNWLGIAQPNLGDWYAASHQCNWPWIKHLVLNCPTSMPPEPVELEPESESKAEAAFKRMEEAPFDRDTIAKMTFTERSQFFSPCFDSSQLFMLCTEKAWTVLGMDMCEVWHHVKDYEGFCGGTGGNPCYCMNHQCSQDRLDRYNHDVPEEFRIDKYTRLPGLDWEPVPIDPVQKEWCDQNVGSDRELYVESWGCLM
ncbi:hypothetical protein EC957_006374 [Mortierella hygrophila]|uniref:Uncharacterized protein n=1 Tax=Mortierella hygrophila TaxID=979708 RepID=A0A9P6JZ51_9FUNG|nr:hypothetical protein EC957_006374 [Mortierella hygrophila]